MGAGLFRVVTATSRGDLRHLYEPAVGSWVVAPVPTDPGGLIDIDMRTVMPRTDALVEARRRNAAGGDR